jgi:RNA polymerase sigma-70 factor (ECF subfamily)
LIREEKITEDKLIALLRNEPSTGVALLYDNYSSALYGVIFRIVEDQETSEDILQEVFVKIWKNINSYDSSKGKLFTWMLNIARNAAIDKLRSKDYQKSSKVQSIDNSVYTINKHHNTTSEVDHIGLKKIVEQLKPEHQQVIDILYFKGYTQSEAAEELKIPLGTVKTRIKAAITQLRTLLGE